VAVDLEHFKGKDVPLNLYGGKKEPFIGKVSVTQLSETGLVMRNPAGCASFPSCCTALRRDAHTTLSTPRPPA